MNNNNNNKNVKINKFFKSTKTRNIVILIILVILLTVGSTYAYFLWTSPDIDVSLQTENITLTIDGGPDIVGASLVPVDNKSKGIIKDISIVSGNNDSVYLGMFFHVNSIDTGLPHETFVWEIYDVNNTVETLIGNGNFASASAGMDINALANFEIDALVTKNLRLYIYIDGESGINPNSMQNKDFDFTLNTTASTMASTFARSVMDKAASASTLASIESGSYLENGDFLIINRAPLGSASQLNVQSYEYRYKGLNPLNYVWFNCSAVDSNGKSYGADDYSYNETNCEKWRIIGVFLTEIPVYSNGNIVGYNREYRTKIIRDDSIGSFSWDNKESRTYPSYYGHNDWSTARLMKTLNPNYETNNEDDDATYENNSLYWNRSSGTCYSGASVNYTLPTEINCTFVTSGLKNESHDYIDKVKYYLGFQNSTSFVDNIFNNQMSNNKWLSNAGTFLTNEIGLMYASDYGYAAGAACAIVPETRKVIYNSNNDDYRLCSDRNWLYNGTSEWTLSTSSSDAGVYRTDSLGFISDQNAASIVINVRPVFHLKSQYIMKGGIGSSDNPYIIGSLD